MSFSIEEYTSFFREKYKSKLCDHESLDFHFDHIGKLFFDKFKDEKKRKLAYQTIKSWYLKRLHELRENNEKENRGTFFLLLIKLAWYISYDLHVHAKKYMSTINKHFIINGQGSNIIKNVGYGLGVSSCFMQIFLNNRLLNDLKNKGNLTENEKIFYSTLKFENRCLMVCYSLYFFNLFYQEVPTKFFSYTYKVVSNLRLPFLSAGSSLFLACGLISLAMSIKRLWLFNKVAEKLKDNEIQILKGMGDKLSQVKRLNDKTTDEHVVLYILNGKTEKLNHVQKQVINEYKESDSKEFHSLRRKLIENKIQQYETKKLIKQEKSNMKYITLLLGLTVLWCIPYLFVFSLFGFALATITKFMVDYFNNKKIDDEINALNGKLQLNRHMELR